MSATTKETAVDSREPAPKKVKSDNAPSTKGTVSGCKKVTDVDETSQAPACKPTKGKCKLEPKKEPVEYGSQPMDFGSTESDSGAEYSEDEELRAEIDAAIESISNGSRSPEVIELSSDDMDTTSTVVQTKRKTPERPKKRSGEGKVESARKAIVLHTLPGSEQKGKNTEALIKLRTLCHKIRTKSDAELEKCMDSKNIQEYPKGTLFEVTALEKKTGEHGDYGIMTCSTVISGRRVTGKVRISNNAVAGFHAEPPCLLLYCGTRQGRSQRVFVDVAVTKLPTKSGSSSMKEVADNWRKMSFAALRSMMQTQPLDNFPKNTVFIYKDPRKKLLRKGAAEDSLVVDFETVVQDEYLTGSLAVPKRLEEEIFRQNIGVLLWRGTKISQKEGRTYNDVVVLDVNSADAFANLVPA